MSEMTGTVKAHDRAKEWESKRVFFCTSEVLRNDIQTKICPAEKVVCLVLDEAHK